MLLSSGSSQNDYSVSVVYVGENAMEIKTEAVTNDVTEIVCPVST